MMNFIPTQKLSQFLKDLELNRKSHVVKTDRQYYHI